MLDKREELLIVAIDLGNDSTDSIKIYEGDSLVHLAQAFCHKHHLSAAIQPSIEAFLHQQVLALRQCSDSVRTTDLSSSLERSGDQPGVRLYNAALTRLKQREVHMQQQKEAKAKSELDGFTFKPVINKTPPKTVKGKTPSPAPETPKTCTFSPAICKRSERLALSMDKEAGSVYERLYSKRETPKQTLEQSSTPQRKLNLKDSVERLYRPRILKKTESVDKINESFSPVTGRKPATKRPGNVFNHLYSQRNKNRTITPPPKETGSVVNRNSTKIMEKLKLTKFKSLFQQCCPVKGLISYETVRRSKLKNEVKTVLAPLLQELKETDEELTLAEFCEALDALIKVLAPNEKHILLFNDK